MASKTNDPAFKMTKTVTEVKLLPDVVSGIGPYQTDDLREGRIEVMGTMYHFWEDGSGTPCYLVLNKDFVVCPRAFRLFSVVDWTG